MRKGKSSFDSSRREFLKKTSAGVLSASLFGNLPSAFANTLESISAQKSKVVLVRHSQVISQEGVVNSEILTQMLETALAKFSGSESSASLWRKLFVPQDVIGIKVNLLGLNSISNSNAVGHYSALINAIINSAGKAEFESKNFIVWDRNSEEFSGAALAVQKESGKVRFFGTVNSRNDSIDNLYSPEIKVGDKATRISKILTEMCSALINVPVMKDHGTAGFTGALKNHYGTISNPRDFHSNNCTNPGIPEINALPEIRSKQKLIIADALMGVFNGGPRWNRDYMWPYGGILVSTDPVAVDRVMLGILNEKRKAEGLNEIGDSAARHIKLSAEQKLGVDDLSLIDLQKIELG